MFIQVIHGKVADPDLLTRQVEAWRRDVKPGATGYLGSTSGFAADGSYLVLVRFESEAAAQANSQRAEQAAWWSETAKAFDGDPSFHDCAEVDTVLGGGSDEAGFVQVIEGRAKDPDAVRSMGRELEANLKERRPDVLGMVVAWHGDGGFTQAVYFRSEQEARQREQETEQDAARQRVFDAMEGAPTFLDIRQPDLD